VGFQPMSRSDNAVWTVEDLELASIEYRGPVYEWLQRVHAVGGDELIRALAIEVMRAVKQQPDFPCGPDELIQLLVAWTRDPDTHRDALRSWLASDAWTWRETAKLAFEWGGATRTGERLIQQSAIVIWCYLEYQDPGQDPMAQLAAVRERMPELPD
jgi:hypothetical protein